MGNAPHKILYHKEADMPIDLDKKGLQFKDEVKADSELTGWERVKKLYELDVYGDISPDIQRCKDTILFSFFGGVVIGGVGRSRVAYMEFFRTNMHTAFENPLRARSKLQETVLLGFGSGAWRLGWRIAAFSSIYAFTSMTLTAYRGKPSILDHTAGGAAAGFVYKFMEGPKYAVAGTVIGGIFGLAGGSITAAALAIAGLTPDEILSYNRQQIYDKRKKEHESLHSLRPPLPDAKDQLDKFQAEMLGEEREKKPETSDEETRKLNTSQSVLKANSTPEKPVQNPIMLAN